MSAPKKMWSLSSGHYSDYSVKALFATKKMAEDAVRLDKADKDSFNDPYVESFDVHDELPDFVTVYFMTENLWDDGTTSAFRSDAMTHLPWNHYWDYGKMGRPKVDFIRAPMHNGKGGRLEVRGTDEQAVKQAFSDNKARILAESQGVA